MKIKNNRRARQEILFVIASFSGIAIFIGILNFFNNNPRHDFGFYAMLLSLLILPTIAVVIEHRVTAKTIVLENEGVAEYKKGKLVKFLIYDEIQSINVFNSSIDIHGTYAEDYPYHHVNTLTNYFIKLLTSKDFRKRYFEKIIRFKNHKKGFDEIELPFITAIAEKSGCKIIYQNNKNI